MTAGLLASSIGRNPQPTLDEHAYGIFLQSCRNAPAFSAKSPSNLPTQGCAGLAIVATLRPSSLLSNQLEFSRIKKTAGLLASDIGHNPQPTPDKHAYGIFVHGRRNAPAFCATSPLAPKPFCLQS